MPGQSRLLIRQKVFLVSLTVIIVSAFWVGISYFRNEPLFIFNSTSESTNKSSSDQRIVQENSPSISTGVKFSGFPQALVTNGVIDLDKYNSLSLLSEEEKKLFSEDFEKEIILDDSNSGVLLNLLWGLGLAQKNIYLENSELGQMKKEGQLENLASTGGWMISSGTASKHFSQHNILNLTEEQQKKVSDMAHNIYRPCCNNHARFSDCNHGMAILGLLSLGVSQNLSDQQIYQLALKANYSWFPEQYAVIFNYLEVIEKKNPGDVSPRAILSNKYSSASGFTQVQKSLSAVSGGTNQRGSSGGGCSL